MVISIQQRHTSLHIGILGLKRRCSSSGHVIGKRSVIGYARVSTEEQATTGVSLDAQQVRINAFAVAIGLTISDIVVDHGISAKTLMRPGLKKILDGVSCGTVGTVIVVKLDRLTRSTRDLAELLEMFGKVDAALVSVSESLDTSSAAGRMVVNMLGVVAQWEREAIGERTATALAHKRKRGIVYGPEPFGYRQEGKSLVFHPAEQEVRQRAKLMDEQGASFRQIATYLSDSGHRPRRGKKWYASSVRAMLRSKIASDERDMQASVSPIIVNGLAIKAPFTAEELLTIQAAKSMS